MPVLGSSLVSASDFTLKDSSADVLTFEMLNDCTGGDLGHFEVWLGPPSGGVGISLGTVAMTNNGAQTANVSVDLDAVYEALPTSTSGVFTLTIEVFDEVSDLLETWDAQVTGTIDTDYVYPAMSAAKIRRDISGSTSPVIYAGYGDFTVTGGSYTTQWPSRGAAQGTLVASWTDAELTIRGNNIRAWNARHASDYAPITAPVHFVYTDSRGLSVSMDNTDPTDIQVVSDYALPTVAVAVARGAYSGGVWTPSDIGDDVQAAVTLGINADAEANGETGNITITLDGAAPVNTPAVSASGTYLFYWTGISQTDAHVVNVAASDTLGYGTTEEVLSIPALNVVIQVTPDGDGVAFFGNPTSENFEVNAAAHMTSLTLDQALPVSAGGTGGKTAQTARASLGVNYPNLGVAPINYGGTGAQNPADARANLGITYGNLGTVGITNGGTGATTRGDALANLNGVANAPARSGITYGSLDLTGLVSASATIYSVANAAPANSVITWTHSTNHTMYLTNAPENTGVVTLTKGIGTNYMSAIFYGQSGRAYFWKYSGSNSNFNNYWQRLSVASAITISDVTAAQTLTTTATRVNLDNSTAVNASDDSLSIINYGIRCNYPGYVEISAQLYAGSVTAGDRLNLNIYAGQSGSLSSIRVARYDSPATHVTGNIVPFLYNCAAGDLIYLYAHNGTAARGSIATGNQTYLTVKYV